jgi:hypothetical protein
VDHLDDPRYRHEIPRHDLGQRERYGQADCGQVRDRPDRRSGEGRSMTDPNAAEHPLAGSTPPQPAPAQGIPAQGRGRRKVIPATCERHRGSIGFTNLLVSMREGNIVLDPHVDGSCVIYLDQDAATELCTTLTEWLG